MVGMCGFLYPKFSDENKAAYLNIHVYFGGLIFILSIVACISGINQKNILA